MGTQFSQEHYCCHTKINWNQVKMIFVVVLAMVASVALGEAKPYHPYWIDGDYVIHAHYGPDHYHKREAEAHGYGYGHGYHGHGHGYHGYHGHGHRYHGYHGRYHGYGHHGYGHHGHGYGHYGYLYGK